MTGTYQWDATYSGDANNNAVSDNNAASGAGDGQHRPAPRWAPPPTRPRSRSARTPVTLTDTATLAGGFNPTGTITFTLFHNGGTTPVDTETVTVNGNGTYTTPTGFTLPTAAR